MLNFFVDLSLLGLTPMKEIDLIIYDLDGTLIDSVRDITDAVNAMLEELGLAARPQEEIKYFIGQGVQNLVAQSIGPDHVAMAERGLKILRRTYGEHLLNYTKLYPGVLETLQSFQSKKQVVITNKPEKFNAPILKGLGIDRFFSLVIGGDSKLAKKKPSPDPILYVLKKYNVTAGRAVIVGDSWVDIETGKNAGIMTCAVTYGIGGREELLRAGADFVLDRFDGLTGLFC